MEDVSFRIKRPQREAFHSRPKLPILPTTRALWLSRLRLKCDGTRAENIFHLSAKRTSPFKSAEASVQSTAGSPGVRISGSNAGYTMFRGSVKSTGYPLHSPVSASLPLSCVTVCHHISTGLYRISHPLRFNSSSLTYCRPTSLSSSQSTKASGFVLDVAGVFKIFGNVFAYLVFGDERSASL
jgi:hypothetical protein